MPPAVTHLAQWYSLGTEALSPVSPCISCGCCKLCTQATPRQPLRAQKGTGKETNLVPGPDKHSQTVFTERMLTQNPPRLCQLTLPSLTSSTFLPSWYQDHRLPTGYLPLPDTYGWVRAGPTCTHLAPQIPEPSHMVAPQLEHTAQDSYPRPKTPVPVVSTWLTCA